MIKYTFHHRVLAVGGLTFIMMFMVPGQILAQQVRLSGRVIDSVSKQGVDLATIIVFESKQKVYSDQNGVFEIVLPQAGNYTMRISAAGLKAHQEQIAVVADSKKDFVLQPQTVSGQTLTISSDREKQKVSRHTLNVSQLKQTPATLGDPLNALTSLPGISRTGVLVGPLVMRAMSGAYTPQNYYEIDSMPMLFPQHFGGIHSVISLDLTQSIDLYASAFPAEYGNSIMGVIDFNTIDEVQQFGGFASMNIISSNFLVKAPIDNQGGYAIAGGRIGYLSFLVPTITRAMGNEVSQLPDYHDYQIKIKKFLDQKAKHSMRLLFLGANDKWIFIPKGDEGDDAPAEADPFNFFWSQEIATSFNNIGVYYNYSPSEKFVFEQLVFSTFNRYDTQVDNQYLPENLHNFGNNSKQNIYGQRNYFILEYWKDHSELKIGSEIMVYDFDSDIRDIIPTGSNMANLDPMRPGDFTMYLSKDSLLNLGYGSYVENIFRYSGWKFVPGLRLDGLNMDATISRPDGKTMTANQTLDPLISPRALVSYTLPSETTIALAGGYYQSYIQSSPIWMQAAPEIASSAHTQAEQAIHRVLSIEQKFDDLHLGRLEIFYNNLDNLVVTDQRDPSRVDSKYQEHIITRNTGKSENYGLEIIFRRDQYENQTDGFHGWASYTFTHARFNYGLPQLALTSSQLIESGALAPDKADGQLKTEAELESETALINKADNNWFTHPYESSHSVKMVVGYGFGRNSIGLRYELSSSYPYTPIDGDDKAPITYEKKGEQKLRYQPTFGEDYSKKYKPTHRLDLRFARKTHYEWGHYAWYIEIIFITNKIEQESWDYSKPYQAGSNPSMKKPDQSIPFIPLFGLEVKF